MKGHVGDVTSLAVLSNGHLASGSWDKTIKIWTPLNATLLRTINNLPNYVTSLAALANGNLVSGSTDQTIKIWTLNNQTLNDSGDFLKDFVTIILQNILDYIIKNILKDFDLKLI